MQYGRGSAAAYPVGQRHPERRICQVRLLGRPAQRLTDDAVRLYLGTEETARHPSDLCLLLRPRPSRGQRGGGSDMDQPVRPARPSCPSNEHGHVGTLSAPVRVQFVQDEEAKALRRSHELLFVLTETREHEFKHYVVSQENVGWILDDLSSPLGTLLARVPGERDGRLTLRIAAVEELLQFTELGVREGVHRVDDDGLDSPAAAATHYVVHDGDDVGERLPGSGAGS